MFTVSVILKVQICCRYHSRISTISAHLRLVEKLQVLSSSPQYFFTPYIPFAGYRNIFFGTNSTASLA